MNKEDWILKATPAAAYSPRQFEGAGLLVGLFADGQTGDRVVVEGQGGVPVGKERRLLSEQEKDLIARAIRSQGGVGARSLQNKRVGSEIPNERPEKRLRDEGGQARVPDFSGVERCKSLLKEVPKYLQKKDYEGVIRTCKVGLSIEGITPIQKASLYISLGLGYCRQGDYVNGIIAYDEGLKIDEATSTQRGILLYRQGITYLGQGDCAKAVKTFGLALEIDGVEAKCEIYFPLGKAYCMLGDYAEAVKTYKMGLKIEGITPEVRGKFHLHLGNAYGAAGERAKGGSTLRSYAKAELSYKSGLAIEEITSETRCDIYFKLGKVYCNQGYHNKGIKAYKEGLKVDKISFGKKNDLLLNLGKLYFRKGEYAKTVRVCEEGLKSGEFLEGQKVYLHFYLLKSRFMQKEYDEAEKNIEAALKIDGITNELRGCLYQNYSEVCLARGHDDKAMVCDMLALGYFKSLADTNVNKIKIVSRCEEYGDGVEVLERLYKLLGTGVMGEEQIWYAISMLSQLAVR